MNLSSESEACGNLNLRWLVPEEKVPLEIGAKQNKRISECIYHVFEIRADGYGAGHCRRLDGFTVRPLDVVLPETSCKSQPDTFSPPM